MSTSDWRVVYRFNPKTDTFSTIAARAATQIGMAKSFNKRAVPFLEKALANAKNYFDKKKKAQKKSPMSHVGGYMSSKNINSFLKAVRR